MAKLYEWHLLGATTAPRTATYQGREHLVVPVVALMEGVIHAVNAAKPEFVPAERLASAAHTWNGRPAVLMHPTRDGAQVSANSPEVLAERQFGTVFEAKMAGSKMAMEAWIDPARLEAMGQTQLLADLRAGKPIEVSVGAYVTTREKAGIYNGKRYAAEWAGVVGDHLAFLPGGEGACNGAMGCGANRAAMRVLSDSFELVEDSVKQSIIDPVTLKCLRDIPQSERDEMNAADFAGPDESFPIKTQADVDAVKRLIGHAANPDAVKAKVITIAKRKGLTIPDAWKEPKAAAKLLERIKDRLGLRTADAAEEAAELIVYRTMKTLLDQAAASLDEARSTVDDLIADETENPTETAADEDAEEEVEAARCESVQMLCYAMTSMLMNVTSLTAKQLLPDVPEATDARYAEAVALRTAVGKEISAKNAKTIQSAHDAAHAMHDQTTALGADCPGDMKAAAAGDCTCGLRAAQQGETMDKETRNATIARILAAKDSGFVEKQRPVLVAMDDEQLEAQDMLAAKGIRALATSKADAEKVIKDKSTADEALKLHAAKLAERDGKADDGDGEQKAAAAKLKAAKAAGFDTIEAQEQAEFYAKNPEIKALVDRQKSQNVARKAELLTALKGGPLSEDQLKAKSLDDLETLAAFAKVEVADYSGRGLPRAASAGSEDAYLNPPNPYAPGIAKMRGEQAAK